LICGGFLVLTALLGSAYTVPSYFTNLKYFAGLIFVEVLGVAIWMYRRAYFPLVVAIFLWAGLNLPSGSGWNVARWVALGLGALVGLLIVVKERCVPFRPFHLAAIFALLSTIVSVSVSRHGVEAVLKASSLGLLFLYAGTGARLAVLKRENQFFSGLVNGCEIFVAVIAVSYLVGFEVLGNPNSLGAVMGVVAAPLLLWGIFVSETHGLQVRRTIAFALCVMLIFFSHARAGMAAAAISCIIFCLSLRRYKVLMQGAVLITILGSVTAVIYPEAYSNTMTSLTNQVIFKGKASDPFLSSRQSPWHESLESIEQHFWFGTGFGTSGKGEDPHSAWNRLSSSAATTMEHGSSYLAILDWVGVLGVLPFLVMVLAIAKRVIQTIVWMTKTRSPLHPSIPIAMVMIAGLIHAGFEDWLFAPGYYVTVFFWSMAFVNEDYAPTQMNGWWHRALGYSQHTWQHQIRVPPHASA
jgi:O-antigen ligase